MLSSIQKIDYDRYLCTIFADRASRDKIALILSFNIEIAKIKNKVSDENIGRIRLKWWEEAVEEIYDDSKTPRKHDIVTYLAELTRVHPNIKKDHFLDIINAREADLYLRPFQTIKDFEEYLELTSFSLNKIAAEIEDIQDKEILCASRHFSIAWGVTAVIRSLARNFSNNRVPIPIELMQEYEMKLDNLGSAVFLNKSFGLVENLCFLAEEHLSKGREAINNYDKSRLKKASSILIYGKIAEFRLSQIKKNCYNVLSRDIYPYMGMFKLIKLYLNQKRGQF